MHSWILPLAVSVLTSASFAQTPCAESTRFATLGTGTTGALGVPELTVVGAPVIGGTFALQVRNGAPGAFGLILSADGTPASPQPVPQYGGVFYPSGPLDLLPFQLDAEGVSPLLHFSADVAPELCGRMYVAQAAMIDATATGGVSLSAGLDLEFGVPRTGLFPGARYIVGDGFGSGHEAYILSVAASDLNRDGNTDLATANHFSRSVSILLGVGGGRHGDAQDIDVGGYPTSLAVSDLSGDGIPDLAVVTVGPNKLSILLGAGDGSFGDAQNYAFGYGRGAVAISDLNGDGSLDIVVAKANSGDVWTLLGAGDGSFGALKAFVIGSGAPSLAISDVNGDGIPDVAVVNSTLSNVSILLGAGDGCLTLGQSIDVGASPRSVAVSDLNGDGNPDLAIANSDSVNVSVLFGAGDGSFGNAQSLNVGGKSLLRSDLGSEW